MRFASVVQQEAAWVSRWSRLRKDALRLRELSTRIDLDEFSASDVTPHGESDTEKDEPWKTLLSMPARCAWRVSGSPDAVNESIGKIMERSARTRKQLRRTHESVMDHHASLAMKKDQERRRVLLGGKERDWEKRKREDIHPVLYGTNECFSDFYFRVVPHYAVVRRILQESTSLLGRANFKPRRVIDFGVGCGSASAAALDQFGDSIQWVHGIDPSQVMREAAAEFLNSMPQQTDSITGSTLRTTFSTHLALDSDASQFDLALFAYTAMELPDTGSSLAAAALLWEKLQPGGLFVMVEPGTPMGFLAIRTVRSMLIDATAENADIECNIVAPCTHSQKCPMDNFDLDNKVFKRKKIRDKHDEDEKETSTARAGFCSFGHTLPSAGGKKEKFSYIVAQKRRRGDEDTHDFLNDSLPTLLQQTTLAEGSGEEDREGEHGADALLQKAVDLERRFLDSDDDPLGLELIRGKDNRAKFGRVIHAPKKRKGHIFIDTCVSPGALTRVTVTKSMSKTLPGIYSAAKRSRWGGLWPHVQGDEEL